MKSALLFSTFIIAGGAFAFWVAGAMPPFGGSPQEAPPPRQPIALESMIYGVGYVEPSSEIRQLTFKIDGVIEKSLVGVGERVKAGKILCTLRNQDEQAAVDVAKQELTLAEANRAKLLSGVHPAEVEAAKRRVSALEAKLEFFQQRYRREQNLIEQKVTTEETLEQVVADLKETTELLKEARAQLKGLETFVRKEDRLVADARVELAAANLAAARARFDDTLLRAPIDGTVLEILKREGEAVRVFDPTPVLVFGDTLKLRVRAEFDERFVRRITVGQKATLSGRGMGKKPVAGRVSLVKAIMGKKTVFSREAAERKDVEVLQVFIEPNEPLDLPIGLKIDVELSAKRAADGSGSQVAGSLPSQ